MNRIFFLIVLAIMVVVSSCASTSRPNTVFKNGVEYGKLNDRIFDSEWWDFYDVGLDFMTGGFYKEAVESFESALKLRKGDKIDALMYGFNYCEYFPYREMGICYYHLGDSEKALEFLRLSQKKEPSKRAQDYLRKLE